MSRLIYLSLMVVFLELILPSNHLRSLFRLVAGLLLLIVLLQPLDKVLLAKNDLDIGDKLAFPTMTEQRKNTNTVFTAQQQFRDLYRKRLERQIELFLADAGYDCHVKAELHEKADEPVIKGLKIVCCGDKTVEERLVRHLADEYHIKRALIVVSND